MEIMENLRGGMSPGWFKMYIKSYKRAYLCVALVEVRENLRGGISPGNQEGPKCASRATNLHLFCGAGVEVMENLRGGISPKRPKMYN